MSEVEPVYRAFLLDTEGKIWRSEYISAESDAEAIEKLRAIPSSHGVELWDRDRRIASHGTAD